MLQLADGPGGNADYYQFTTPNNRDFQNPVSWLGVAGFETTANSPAEVAATWLITTPGEYTVRIVMREDGLMFDTLVLQLASLPAPTGNGPSSSPLPAGAGPTIREFRYDSTFNLLTTEIDGLGHTTRYRRDPATGNIIRQTREVDFGGGPNDVVTQFTYTAQGLIDLETDPLGRVTDYDYDARGRLITVTKAKGTTDQGIVRYEYDQAGNITAIIDENGNRTEIAYDALNRLLTTTAARSGRPRSAHLAGHHDRV